MGGCADTHILHKGASALRHSHTDMGREARVMLSLLIIKCGLQKEPSTGELMMNEANKAKNLIKFNRKRQTRESFQFFCLEAIG